MSEMVERIGEAIYQAMQAHGINALDEAARAAIAAMREPTEVMLEVWASEDTKIQWQAMIDAALKDP